MASEASHMKRLALTTVAATGIALVTGSSLDAVTFPVTGHPHSRNMGSARPPEGGPRGEPGEHVFAIDPRLVRLPELHAQLQLGVKGTPGAFAVFEDVVFLPPESLPNRGTRSTFQPGQKDIPAVDLMPNLPEPYALIDWREKARAYDRFVFDFEARGEFLPLAWIDEARIDIGRPAFGLPSYVGDPHRSAARPGSQEGERSSTTL